MATDKRTQNNAGINSLRMEKIYARIKIYT